MPDNAGDSLIIQAAKPTVRLKGKQHEYGETQDSDVFARSGRPETDVMDDDRWLERPKTFQFTNLILTDGKERTAVVAAPVMKSPGHLLIWNAATLNSNRKNEARRVPQEQHLVHNLLSRACRLHEDHGQASSWKSMKKELRGSVFKELSMDSTINFVFVGISALNCQPVVMVRDDNWEETGAELASDNMESVALRALPELSPGTKEIIWLENMMIPGNISYVKKALWGRLTGVEKKRFLEVMKREHILLVDDLNPSGVATLLPSNEEHKRKPRFDRSIHDNDAYNYHYRLRWPPIGLLEIPSAMVKSLKEFLSNFHFDNYTGRTLSTYRRTRNSSYQKHLQSKAQTPWQTFCGLLESGETHEDHGSDWPSKGSWPYLPRLRFWLLYQKAMTPFLNFRFGVAAYYRQNFPLREALTTSIREQTSTMNNELNRIAEYFRVPPLQRQVNPETLLLDWCGIDTHLQDLIGKGDLDKVAEGELKRAASPEAPTPHAKRIKTEEHEIDPTIALQINSLIDALPARSRDWYALEMYLKSGLTPKVQGAQYMLSCVRSFISDMDIFSTASSNELVDDLDIFIRMSLRAAGLFDKQQLALLNYEESWGKHREAFSKISPVIGNAIEAIYRLRGPGGFVLAYPLIKVLGESPLISTQIEAFKKIEGWLEEQATKTD
ncbi:hypothetical protein QYS62_002892 [Fusarium acuminatum]|uniref:Uncharacterized protein n=1 Tax=Fusarium acuminatum TaxID=5515 RepID=A0ABZ2WN53_9HYPO